MFLRESIESINNKLFQEFGVDINCSNLPKFRVVFSEDQYEKRWTNYTDEGFELLHPEVRTLPKYKQYIHEKYLLEKLVPIEGETDLIEKFSYECIWTFQDRNGNYLPPFYEGCRHVIISLMEAMNRGGHYVKYRDKNISQEERLAELKKVEDQLFGDETDIGDALRIGSAVGFTTSKTLH